MKIHVHLHEDLCTFTRGPQVHLHQDPCTFTWRSMYIYVKTHVHLHEDPCTFTWRPMYIYMKTHVHLHEDPCTFTKSRRILLIIKSVSDRSCKENQNILWSKTFFKKSCSLRDNVQKYGRLTQATTDNIIRHMLNACWINKVTDTHKHTQRICNSYCFPTATLVKWTLLDGTIICTPTLPGLFNSVRSAVFADLNQHCLINLRIPVIN